MIIRKLTINRTVLDLSQLPGGDFPEFAFVGRSNVGKSSLLNTLFNRKNFAQISKDPGKTRTINFYLVNDRFFLVDMPGYGFAKVSKSERKKWRRIMEDYLSTREKLRGVVLLVDARVGPTDDDIEMLTALSMYGRDFMVALTKSDKVKVSSRRDVVRRIEEGFENAVVVDVSSGEPIGAKCTDTGGMAVIYATFFSARTKEGRGVVWKWIEDRL